MGVLHPDTDLIPGPDIYPGMEWPVVFERRTPLRHLDVPAKQHDNAERLRRLALRKPPPGDREFPGRFGAALRSRGGGALVIADVGHVMDPRPSSVGGADEFEFSQSFTLDFGPAETDERYLAGVWIDFLWPTRAKVVIDGVPVWNGFEQTAFTPDPGPYHPFESLAFLGTGRDPEEMAIFGFSGADRYTADTALPWYQTFGGSWVRQGVFYAFDTSPGPRSHAYVLDVQLLDDTGAVMTSAWVEAYHLAHGGHWPPTSDEADSTWPPMLTINSVMFSHDQLIGRLTGAVATANNVVFDTVDFQDPGFAPVRLAGTELPGTDPATGNPRTPLGLIDLPNAIFVPEPGWYRYVAGADVPFTLKAAHDMAAADIELLAEWDTGSFADAASPPGVLDLSGGEIIGHYAAGQVKGLVHIPQPGHVRLIVQPTGGVDQGGPPGYAGNADPSGATPTGSVLNTRVTNAHLSVWRYFQ